MNAIVLGTVLLTAAIFSNSQMSLQDTVAIAGCCKQKLGAQWVYINSDFDDCVSMNASEGDDVFEPVGNYWWDVTC